MFMDLKITKKECVTSTNTYLKNHIDLFSYGDVLLADSQTQGRGRRGNLWQSPKGNIYMTVLEKPLHVNFHYIMLVSVAVVNLLKDYSISATIKYPNDILVNKKKIAGILIERLFLKNEKLLIGMGLNVNQTTFDNFSIPATSIKNELKETFKCKDIIATLLERIAALKKLSHENLLNNYKTHSYISNKQLGYNGEIYTIFDILKNGKIVLKSGDKTKVVTDSEIDIKEIL